MRCSNFRMSFDLCVYRFVWWSLAVVVLCFCSIPTWVDAFPTGAGACPAGKAAVGGYHLDPIVTDSETGRNTSRIVRSGTLSEGEIVVQLGESVLSAVNGTSTNAKEAATFLLNQKYNISVFNNRYEYKGILIRLEFLGDNTTDMNNALLPGENNQLSMACFGDSPNVIGITHSNSTFKSITSGFLQVEQAGLVALDITIVGLNNASASLYGYDRFLLQFGESTNAPIATSTPKPSLAPSVSPVAGPTMAPTPNATTSVALKNTTGLAFVPVEQALVQSIHLTLTVVKELTQPEIRAWERTTMEWFQQFYNDSEIDRTRRSLQTTSNNYGVVLGSMETFINVTNVTYLEEMNASSSNRNSTNTTNTTTPMNVTLTYDQILSYHAIVNASYPGSMQYVTLPFRSKTGRRTYVGELASSFYAFSQLSVESLAIPTLEGPPVSNVTTNATTNAPEAEEGDDDSFLSVGGIVGIALAGGVVIAALLYIVWDSYRQKHESADPSSNFAGVETFSFAPSFHPPRGGGGGGDSTYSKTNEYIVYAPAGRLGVVLDSGAESSDEGPVICMIKEGSPLMESAIEVEVGDHLVALDDIDVRKMSPTKVSKLLNKRSKQPLRKLTLIRSNHTRKVVQVTPKGGDGTVVTPKR